MNYQSKAALSAFLKVIESADSTFLDPEKVIDEQGRVDGYQHLFHLMKTSIDFCLLNDPLRPTFKLLADESHKMLGDNVDSIYYFTQLRGDQEYRISGRRFDSCYLSFSVYSGKPDGSFVDRVSASINHTKIDFDEEGRFSIKLTPNPQGPQEFSLDEEAVNLFTREYFFDRPSGQQSELRIENLTPTQPPKPLSDEELAARIRVLTTFFEQTTWIAPLPVEFPLNEFLPPFPFEADQGGFGTVDNTYCFGRFRLEEDECLKITLKSPPCTYWGIQTWNFLMQSTDFAHYPTCKNSGSSKQNDDGSYTIYLSHKPMEVDNWISTAGYKEAILFCRWLLVEGDPEAPTAVVEKIP